MATNWNGFRVVRDALASERFGAVGSELVD